MTQKLILRHGDCVEVLKGYEDGSIGAIVSDPPYGLKFMNKDFDDLGEGASQRKWHEAWLTEAYRVLRPGGVIKAFNGTRTFHHMAYAMQEAGFVDLRVTSWNYGSGFPKSMNIGKALDALLLTGGSHSTNIKAVNALRPGEGVRAGPLPNNGIMSEDTRAGSVTNDNPATETAHHWQGWGTALKPSWEPVVVGRKPE